MHMNAGRSYGFLRTVFSLCILITTPSIAGTDGIRTVVIDSPRADAVADDRKPEFRFVFVDAEGRAVPFNELESQVSLRLAPFFTDAFPVIEISEQRVVSVLNTMIALVNGGAIKQTLSKGGMVRPVGPSVSDLSIPIWLSACELGDQRIVMPETRQASFLEVLYCVAHSVDLEIGVLDTGEVIAGRPSRWHPEYVPLYVMKPVSTDGKSPGSSVPQDQQGVLQPREQAAVRRDVVLHLTETTASEPEAPFVEPVPKRRAAVQIVVLLLLFAALTSLSVWFLKKR